MNLEQIEARLAEIRSMNLDDDSIDIEALNKEMDELLEKRNKIIQQAEQRQQLRNRIAQGIEPQTPVDKPKESRNMDQEIVTRENYLETRTYRSAFLNHLLGRELNQEQRAALNLSTSAPVVYTELQNKVLEKARKISKIFNQITLLRVGGTVQIAVEGVVTDAKEHTENAAQTPDSDTTKLVTVTAKEITKYLEISKSVEKMTIDAFETYLVDALSKALARKIEAVIIGTALAGAVSKTYTTLTEAQLLTLCADLPDGYAQNAKVYMNRKTLLTKVLPIQDKSKNEIIQLVNGTYYLLGSEIDTTGTIADGVILYGDPEYIIGNMAEEITIAKNFNLKSNLYEYLGACMFDCELAFAEAFVKIATA